MTDHKFKPRSVQSFPFQCVTYHAGKTKFNAIVVSLSSRQHTGFCLLVLSSYVNKTFGIFTVIDYVQAGFTTCIAKFHELSHVL